MRPMTHQELQLQGDLRQAVENYVGSMVASPWDEVLDLLTWAIAHGELGAQDAARLDNFLRQTQGGALDACTQCGCRYG